MNLIRKILFNMEVSSGAFAPSNLALGDEYNEDQVAYHVWLLGEAGLMKVTEVTYHGSSGPAAIPINLTWEGHDFLDAARNDTTWSRVMEKAKSVGGTVSFAIFKQMLDAALKGQLGL